MLTSPFFFPQQKSLLLADESVISYLGSMEDAQNDLARDTAADEDEDDFS